jgi:competence protein ComEC
MMRSPLLVLAAFFALGVLGAACVQSQWTTQPATAGLLLAFGGVFGLTGLVALRQGCVWLPTIAVLAGFAAAGGAAELLFPFRFGPDHISRIEERGVNVGRPALLEGSLAAEPLREPEGTEFDLDVVAVEQDGRRQTVTGRVRIWLEAPYATSDQTPLVLESGDWVRVRTELRHPRSYRNPGSFDYRGWLESIQDIYWIGNAPGLEGVEKIHGPEEKWNHRAIPTIRRSGLAAIDRMFAPWGGQAKDGAVLKAVLFGDRTSLDSATIENFRKTGLYHLLVVAGLHVGLVALLAALLLRLLPLGEMWRSSLVLGVVAAYALVVEQRAPTLRATIMIAAYLIGRMLYRERSLLNAVGLAALLLLYVRPAWLFEAGFDFSFSAALLVTGLAVTMLDTTLEPYRLGLRHVANDNRDLSLPPEVAQFRLDLRSLTALIEKRFAFLGRHPRLASTVVVAPVRIVIWFAEALLFSFILQAGVVLPMVLVFHRVALAGAALNALAVPLMGLVIAIAVPSVLFVSLFPTLAPFPAAILGITLRALTFLTNLPHLPVWLSYRLPGPPLWVTLGFVTSLVLAAWARRYRAKIFAPASASFALFLILVCTHPFAPELPKDAMEITALDCGEGEAAFLVLPDRTTALMNTCGAREHHVSAYSEKPWNAGEDIVSPFLWSRGIERVDLLALTRVPGEQRASVEALARNFKFGEIWLDTANASPETFALVDGLERSGAKVRELKGGERLALGSASLRVLWPPGPSANESPSPDPEGREAMVVRITEHGASALLAGNINPKAARALIGSAETIESRVLEIRAGHSSEPFEGDFLRAVSPEVVWTSGARSRGRSSDSARWDFPHVRFFRTDADGAIKITEDGCGLSVRLYRSSSTGWAAAGAGTGWLLTSPASSVP